MNNRIKKKHADALNRANAVCHPKPCERCYFYGYYGSAECGLWIMFTSRPKRRSGDIALSEKGAIPESWRYVARRRKMWFCFGRTFSIDREYMHLYAEEENNKQTTGEKQ